MKDGPMNEPTKREVDWETWLDRLYDVRMEPDKLLIMITNRRGQRAIRAASAQSAESKEAEDDALSYIEQILKIFKRNLHPIIDAHKLNSTQKALVMLAALRARLASKPSRSEAGAYWLDAKTNPPQDSARKVCLNRNSGPFFARHAGNDWLDDDGLLRDPVLYLSLPEDLAHLVDAARPSREEEMRECVWVRSFDGHFNIGCCNETGERANGNFKGKGHGAKWEFIYCPYYGGKIRDDTAAALAQGGARDDGNGEGKR